MTVVVTAVFHPLTGHEQQLVEALRAAVPAVHAEEGCQFYAIHEADDGTTILIEKWASSELLQSHAGGAAVAALDAAVEQHIAAPTTVTTMTPLSVGNPQKGAL